MENYIITGMHCQACQVRVEKAVKAVEGVTDCTVSLLTNSMKVEGDVSTKTIIKAVKNAGYGARVKSGITEIETDNSLTVMRKRFIFSVIILIPLMYVSMGHMMWGFPVPGFLKDNHWGIGIYELVLSGIVLVINRNFFINGFKGIIHKSPNMDTLVALGAAASFGYSVYSLFAMRTDYYFESGAMILTLVTLGKMLEAKAKGKTTNALKSLIQLSPKTAVVLNNGVEETVPVDRVKVGDTFIVKPGSSIPVDGIVKEGFSAVNESAFTGESVPVEKKCGDGVFAATINTNGHMVCEATKVGNDTSLSEIIRMVSDASTSKAPIAKIADKVSGIFVPVVIIIALLTFVIWMLLGKTVGFSITRAVSVLVICCPCALGLATPVAIMVGNGLGARNGILFKTAEVLEMTGKVRTVVLDKTGTITNGKMQVVDIIPFGNITRDELLKTAASLEAKSEHPISKAISDMAQKEGVTQYEVSGFRSVSGNGLEGIINGEKVYGGNEGFVKPQISPDLYKTAKELSLEAKTPVFFSTDKTILGIIAVTDTVRKDSKEAVEKLKKLGIHTVMLTGDNEVTANVIAKTVGVDEFIASVKPDEKENIIRKLMADGKVAMVGDGINDAPALTAADVGMAIGTGTDIAMESADIVLTKSSIMDVAKAIKISRETLKIIHGNLFWAFFYNVIGIPLAAGALTFTGWNFNPMFAAAAMSLSSVCVVTNALRLNLKNII